MDTRRRKSAPSFRDLSRINVGKNQEAKDRAAKKNKLFRRIEQDIKDRDKKRKSQSGDEWKITKAF